MEFNRITALDESRAFSQRHFNCHFSTKGYLPDANDRSILAHHVRLIAQMVNCSNRSTISVPGAGSLLCFQLVMFPLAVSEGDFFHFFHFSFTFVADLDIICIY